MHSSRMRTNLLTVLADTPGQLPTNGQPPPPPPGRHPTLARPPRQQIPPAQCLLGYTPCALPVDRQTPVKTIPSQTSFASGRYCVILSSLSTRTNQSDPHLLPKISTDRIFYSEILPRKSNLYYYFLTEAI